MELDLAGKVAIVTGPAKGMGAAVTLALAREGVDLALAGRDLEAVAPVAAEVKRMGRKAVQVRCDVTDPEQVDNLVRETLAALGPKTS